MQVLEATKMPNLYERLKGSVELLDKIMKGLNAYLEKKRLYFPRYLRTCTHYVPTALLQHLAAACRHQYNTCMQSRTYVRMYVHMCTSECMLRMYIRMYVYFYMYCIHVHMYMYVCTYIRTCVQYI